MDHLERLNSQVQWDRESLERANARYLDALERTLDRCKRRQAEWDTHTLENGQERQIIDVLDESFSWVENSTRAVREARARYEKSVAARDTAEWVAKLMVQGEITVDDIVAYHKGGGDL